MAWSNSKMFGRVLDRMNATAAYDFDGDAFKAALYNNSITPSNTVTAANSAYNVDQWGTAQEVYQAGQWAQAGVALASVTSVVSGAVWTFDAADTASGAAATLANVYGVLVYDDTLAAPVADQGVSYNYLGGANSVVGGTLTVVWNASGIAAITMA